MKKGLKVGLALRNRLARDFTEAELEDLNKLVTKLRDSVFQELGQEIPPAHVGQAIRQRVIRLYNSAPV